MYFILVRPSFFKGEWRVKVLRSVELSIPSPTAEEQKWESRKFLVEMESCAFFFFFFLADCETESACVLCAYL